MIELFLMFFIVNFIGAIIGVRIGIWLAKRQLLKTEQQERSDVV